MTPQRASLDTEDSVEAVPASVEAERAYAEPAAMTLEEKAASAPRVMGQEVPQAQEIDFDEPGDALLGDANAGKAAFGVCRACHSVDEGRNGLGPSLYNVVGRKAGSLEGFKYSDALAASDVVWTAEALDQYLQDSRAFIPGNRMAQLFPAGVKQEKRRRDIIAFLSEQSGE